MKPTRSASWCFWFGYLDGANIDRRINRSAGIPRTIVLRPGLTGRTEDIAYNESGPFGSTVYRSLSRRCRRPERSRRDVKSVT